MSRLRWELLHRRDGWSAEQGREKGREDPDWLGDEPVLPAPAQWYLDAFWDLDTMRPVSQGIVGQVPYDRVVWYGEREGMRGPLLRLFTYLVRALDAAYLKELEARVAAAV